MSRRSLDLTLDLLRSLDRAGSVEGVVKTVQDRLSGFGVETMLAAMIPEPFAPGAFDRWSLVLDNVPDEWKKAYFVNGYIASDPIVRETLNRSTGFAWSDPDLARDNDARALRVMGEASDVGLRDGYTVPLTTVEGARGGMSFIGRRLEIAPEHRGMLTLVASYAFGQALLLRGQMPVRRGLLSPRERETLQWAAEGKTDWEIGELMGISEHGVDSHLKSIRAKLGVTNRAQAVAEGLRGGWIA